MKNYKIKSKNFKFNASGITLIALVITIIVLLILAGVSIATLTGENGILTQANNAKEETEEAEVEELRKLTQGEAATHLEEYEYTDSNGEKVKIPAKCAVSQVEGENTLENGLVIIDVNGNEWVWIEVPESEMPEGLTFESEEDYTTLETALQTYTADYRNSSYTDTWYEGCGLEQNEYINLKQNMLESIYENKGFYIGRYEVGSFDNPVTAENTTRIPVIQQGAYPYNWITCSQAQELSKKLVIGNKTSSLMFGIQWDLVLKYIEQNGSELGNTETDRKLKLITDSTSWGNYQNAEFIVKEGNKYIERVGDIYDNWKEVNGSYIKKAYSDEDWSGVVLSTGSTSRNSVLNIYDLAGNVWEWTLEKYNVSTTGPSTSRGGDCSVTGLKYLAYSRGNNSISSNDYTKGFRLALY